MSNLVYNPPGYKYRSRSVYMAESETSVIQNVSVFIRMQNRNGFNDISVKQKLQDFGDKVEALLAEYFNESDIVYLEIDDTNSDRIVFGKP